MTLTQLNSWDRTEYPADSTGPGLDLDIKAALQSFSGRTIQSWPTTAARDAAFTELSAGAKAGAMAYVVGQGLSYWTGSQWRRVAANGESFMQSGMTGITTQPTGLAIIAFGTAFGGVPLVLANHVTTSFSSPSRFVKVFYGSGYAPTAAAFHVLVTDANGAAVGSEYLDIVWHAHGPRGTD